MRTDEANPSDWLEAGRSRLQSADRLQQVEGASSSVIELLQEAVERYLKGYLISRNWPLQRTHDLNRLLAEAANHDDRFANFAGCVQSLTEQFWEQHYPGGDLSEVGSGYHDLRKDTGELVDLIVASVPARE